jgi:hypothetical protein
MLRYSDMKKQYDKEAWKHGYTPESWSEHQSFNFWAKFIAVILLMLFSLPFISHADTRYHFRQIRLTTSQSTPTTPPVNSTPVQTGGGSPTAGGPSGFCMNVLHDNPTTASAIMSEIQAVKAAGFNCVRLAYQNFNNPSSEQGALDAKSLGMYVILGAEWGTFTQSQFSQYESEALMQFKWCQANGIQQCSLGNEQEYRLSGVSISQWISDAKSIALAGKQLYSGTISYETSGDFTSDWIASGSLGAIDLWGTNLYCGFSCNSSYLQSAINYFGVDHVYVSETGCDAQAIASCQNDAGRAAEIKIDAVLLHKNFPSTSMYFFTWAANGSMAVPNYWAVNDEPLTLSALK